MASGTTYVGGGAATATYLPYVQPTATPVGAPVPTQAQLNQLNLTHNESYTLLQQAVATGDQGQITNALQTYDSSQSQLNQANQIIQQNNLLPGSPAGDPGVTTSSSPYSGFTGINLVTPINNTTTAAAATSLSGGQGAGVTTGGPITTVSSPDGTVVSGAGGQGSGIPNSGPITTVSGGATTSNAPVTTDNALAQIANSGVSVQANPANTTPIKVSDRRIRLTPKSASILGNPSLSSVGSIANTVKSINSLTGGGASSLTNALSSVSSTVGSIPSLVGATSQGSMLTPLQATNGMVFPYTPSISYAGNTTYSTIDPTHANQDFKIYKNTQATTITINGAFTAQNNAEALYLMSCLHFLRVVTKMHFGSGSSLGLPPPVLILNGYGIAMFNNLSVIVTNYTMDLPNNVDYVQVNTAGGIAWVPVHTNISVTCVVQNTPNKLRTFDWDKFASGALLSQGGWS